MIYPLQYLVETTNWRAPIAIIGNGESQTKWRMNPALVDVWAINRALWAYDPPLCLTAADHAGFMERFYAVRGKHTAVIAISSEDAMLHGLRRVSTFNMVMDFVMQYAWSTIYLYGIDMSDDRDWSGIAGAFALSLKQHHPHDLRYVGNANPKLPALTPVEPDHDHLLAI